MAHFAELNDDSMVTRVIVVNNDVLNNLDFPESEPIGVAFCQSLYGSNTIWKQTSYNGNFRKFYAGIGSRYDVESDIFIPASPYPSWVLNTITYRWEAPVNYPIEDGSNYNWDEDSQSWVILEINTDNFQDTST